MKRNKITMPILLLICCLALWFGSCTKQEGRVSSSLFIRGPSSAQSSGVKKQDTSDAKPPLCGRFPFSVVDTHAHPIFPIPEQEFKEISPEGMHFLKATPDEKAKILKQEMARSGVGTILLYGQLNGGVKDPLGIEGAFNVARLLPGARVVGAIDPQHLKERGYMDAVRKQITAHINEVVGLKAYLGYIPYPVDHPGYQVFYKLAGEFNIPVILHTGDVWSHKGLLEYSFPLKVDTMAVKFRNTKFVMAHFGVPWFDFVKEIVFKNENVYADLSGLVVLDEDGAKSLLSGPLPKAIPLVDLEALKKALIVADSWSRITFGSDFPLAPIEAGRCVVDTLIPAEHREKVFRTNAEKLFRLNEQNR